MFGYVTIDKPNILMKDYAEYRAFYCGICVAIRKRYTQLARLCTNYDVTFLTALVYGVKGVRAETDNSGCILNPLRKKSIAKIDPIMERISDTTILLMAYKLRDDVADSSSKKKRLIARMFRRNIKKAEKREPIIDQIIKSKCEELSIYEKDTSVNSLDKLAHPFATLLVEVFRELVGDKANSHSERLMYNIGRFIYFIDAIDDIDKDVEKKNYNPLLAYGMEYVNSKQFRENYDEELTFIINSTYNEIKLAYQGVNLEQYEGIVTHILWYGIPASIMRITKGGCDNNKKGRLILPK